MARPHSISRAPSRAIPIGSSGSGFGRTDLQRPELPVAQHGDRDRPADGVGGEMAMEIVDAAKLDLMKRGNYEILVEWLTIAAGSDYEPVFPRVREVLTRVGRMKYLRPLYGALGGHDRTRALAREIFAKSETKAAELAEIDAWLAASD